MPFQSDKQRRYLWANEPEIAREWTDRYGARGGGIMRIPLANGLQPDPFYKDEEFQTFQQPQHFNLNDYQNVSKDSPDIFYKNRVISHPYEPGSTFKIICFSEALDSDLEKINKKYYCEKGRYKGKYIEPFEDHIKDWDSLNFNDIFIR